MCLIEMLSCVCRLHVLVVNCDDFFLQKSTMLKYINYYYVYQIAKEEIITVLKLKRLEIRII